MADQALPIEEQEQKARLWSMGDVLLVAVMYFVALVLGSFVAMGIAKALHHDAHQAVRNPMVLLAVQLAGYVFAFLCARVIVSLKTGQPFFSSIEWNYPGGERLPQMLLLGLCLAVLVTTTSSALPIPKNLPVEKLFNTRQGAILTMMFATLIAPLAEEIFFRGVFFGALRGALTQERTRFYLGVTLIALAGIFGAVAFKGWGSAYAMFAPILLITGILLLPFRGPHAPMLDEGKQSPIAILLTAMFFAYVHGAQLANAWAPLLMLLLVGLVLTGVRVRLKSVAASWILHTGYNGTLFLLAWAGTAGFTRLS